MSEIAIEMKNVCKHYSGHRVLEDFSLSVPKGAVYALLGNNGAGKSTSIRIMTGQLAADSGTVAVLGLDPLKNAVALRLRMGYVPETERLFDFLTPTELFGFLNHFFPDWSMERATELLGEFHLPPDRKIGSFSRGMYAKTALITVMARKAEVVIFDDPVLGLDTVSRADFMDGLIRSIQEYEHTILVSSHLIPEIEGICDHAGILAEGKLLYSGETEQLKARFRRIRIAGEDGLLRGEICRKSIAGESYAVVDVSENIELQEKGETMNLEEMFLALTRAVGP